jgi:hypothetical protein
MTLVVARFAGLRACLASPRKRFACFGGESESAIWNKSYTMSTIAMDNDLKKVSHCARKPFSFYGRGYNSEFYPNPQDQHPILSRTTVREAHVS